MKICGSNTLRVRGRAQQTASSDLGAAFSSFCRVSLVWGKKALAQTLDSLFLGDGLKGGKEPEA